MAPLNAPAPVRMFGPVRRYTSYVIGPLAPTGPLHPPTKSPPAWLLPHHGDSATPGWTWYGKAYGWAGIGAGAPGAAGLLGATVWACWTGGDCWYGVYWASS